MERWRRGEAEVERLVDIGDLGRVQPSRVQADALIRQSRSNLESATLIKSGNPSGGFVLCYDAIRMAIAALLAHQGLRATRTGGHVAVFEAARAQLGAAATPFMGIRRRRNELEYPSADTPAAEEEDVDELLEVAPAFVASIERLLDAVGPF